MKIENLKELQKLIDLCHKNNIMTVEVDGIKLELGARPTKASRRRKEVLLQDPATGTIQSVPLKEVAQQIATDSLTPEQLLMWSVSGDEAV